MEFFDISMPIRPEMVTWGGKENFNKEEIRSGDSIISHLDFSSSHTGTHIDAPKHFLGDQATPIDEIAAGRFIGSCKVIEIKEVASITAEILKRYEIGDGDRILFKTRNTEAGLLDQADFTTEYVSLDLSGAEYLVNKKISLVGIDYLGIEAKGSPGHPVHKSLLEAGIVIVEGLYLKDIKPGEYQLAVLPLKIEKGDGTPARAVLWLD